MIWFGPILWVFQCAKVLFLDDNFDVAVITLPPIVIPILRVFVVFVVTGLILV